ncbi:hypothetical protein LUZ60_004176 [Juncus effusus]|nr:hypothetical protein LUZ60_004176 [Juncus effusus]
MDSSFSFGFQSLQNTPQTQIHHQFYPQQNNPHSLNSYPQQTLQIYPSTKIASTSEEITTDPSQTEENFTDPNPKFNKKAPTWHRMKWTSTMVRLLITAVSYIDEDFTSPMLKKKGKWRLISKVLAERGGTLISPQQCEDKFNDLNKRYKRLTDILGRGRSCKIVENPSLLDCLSDIPDKLKDEARKILCSKHLFYEEMCSYHNCNRVNLPADPSLRKSLHLAFGEGEFEEGEEQSENTNGTRDDETGEDHGTREEKREELRSEREIREEGLRIEGQMLEIARQKFKWRRFSDKKERELERMRLENERMRMENERLQLELRKKELELEIRKRRL